MQKLTHHINTFGCHYCCFLRSCIKSVNGESNNVSIIGYRGIYHNFLIIIRGFFIVVLSVMHAQMFSKMLLVPECVGFAFRFALITNKFPNVKMHHEMIK